MEDKICVIVPVRENPGVFRKCAALLLSLDYKNYEIVIVDDSEKGITKELSFPQAIRVINSFGKGSSSTRNLAAKNTDAEFLAFADSDCIADKSWLKELIKVFEEHPDTAACGEMQRLSEDSAEFEKRFSYLF